MSEHTQTEPDKPTEPTKSTPSDVVDTPGAAVVSGGQPTQNSPKRMLLPIIGVVVVLLLLLALGWFMTNRDTDTVAHVCSEQTISKASQYIDDGAVSDLGVLAEQITKQDNYQEDPNCVYTVLRYNIMMLDAKDSHKYFDQLKQISETDEGITYSDAFQSRPLTFAEIASTIETIEFNEKESMERNRIMNSQLDSIDEAFQKENAEQ